MNTSLLNVASPFFIGNFSPKGIPVLSILSIVLKINGLFKTQPLFVFNELYFISEYSAILF